MRSPVPFLALAALLLVPRSASPATPDFTEQARFGLGSTICVAWGDYDNDGDPDLAVGNDGGQNYLYVNNGDGTFTEDAQFELSTTFCLVWGDYTMDGLLDLACGNDGAGNRLFQNDGDGTFTSRGRLGNFTTHTISMAWADFDLDGDLDVAQGNGILGNAQQNYLWRFDGGNNFVQVSEFGADQTQSVAWADFDGDGDPDLAVGNGGFGYVGQNYLYVNNGDGTFTQVLDFGTGDTSCLAWGDADNDGDLDLAVANWNGGQNYLYVNNGDGTFTELARFGMRDPNTMNWGDFDDDGDLDLAVGNGDFSSADSNFVYINEGGLAFTESAQFGLGSTDAVAWADFDGDGDLDLAVGNEHSPADNYLYINNSNDSAWLSLSLIGHYYDRGAGYSNRDGIGAKVSVYEAGFLGDPAHLLGYREVEAHGGFSAQNELPVHFGLPGRSTVDVRIVWPGSGGSHLVQDIADVAVPSRGHISEGTSGAVGVVATPAAPVPPVWRIAPNPTSGSVLVEYLRPLRAAAPAEIVDVAGRRIASLALGPAEDGARAAWDGRTESGRRAAPGVYFVNVAGAEQPGRITVIR